MDMAAAIALCANSSAGLVSIPNATTNYEVLCEFFNSPLHSSEEDCTFRKMVRLRLRLQEWPTYRIPIKPGSGIFCGHWASHFLVVKESGELCRPCLAQAE